MKSKCALSRTCACAWAALLAAAATAPAQTATTMDPARRHTWAANTGFINWSPAQPLPDSGAACHEYFLSGKIYSANCGWIDLGDGTPNNAIQYSNAVSFDCGVNVDPATGRLTGYAWSANTGWINFEQTFGKPAINPLTGALTGYAWSPNTGWISLGGNQLATQRILSGDADADGMSDVWERLHFGDTVTTAAGVDSDGDGVSDADEYRALTDPQNAADFLRFTSVARTHDDGENLDFQELTFTTVPARLYTVQLSTDLQTWSNAGGSLTDFPGDPAALTTSRFLTLSPDEKRTFFRVLVRRPLQP